MEHQQRSSAAAIGLAAVCVAALALAGVASTPAAAVPSTYVADASVGQSSVLVGESVTVTAVVGNLGTSQGGHTVEFTRNGSTITTERVVVPADERERISTNVSFQQPGVYELRADDELAGYVRVTRTLATVESRTESQRRLAVRVDGVPRRSTHSVSVPAATNRSLSLRQWNVTTSDSRFEQTVTEYTDPTDAPVPIPSSDATVAGVVSVSSSATVQSTTARVAVNQSRLQSLGLAPENVSLYSYEDGRWQRVETRIVDRQTAVLVYEGTVPNGTTFALGRMSPAFSITGTALDTENAPEGQRIIVEATVANDGAVAGDYEATMMLDDEPVNETTVTVQPGEERTVTLSSVTGSAGAYNVGVNEQAVGVVRIVDSQVQTPTPTAPTETPPATATATPTAQSGGGGSDGGGGPAGDGLLPSSLPDTVAGIPTVLVVGVGVGVLVFLLIGGLLWRSGRSGGRSDPNRW
ncbi:PGF-pre-PGF domain-containing protein [Haloarcula halophila]|uniref:PGF-pre-PGF domain-containing protein n=1 Tax=Haloarcula TaxID=2237 RepID=UPI0023E42E3F|nr:PGF-pre-PGF domain-containing protein [Halomicroarcula sp. DFY41]